MYALALLLRIVILDIEFLSIDATKAEKYNLSN